MAYIDVAFPFITAAESFSANPYWDVNGYAIGYGNHYYEDGSAVSQDDDPITKDRAVQIVTFFINQNAQAILNQVTVPLSDNQVAALTSLRYNCGTITNAVLNLINSGADPATVAAQIQKTCTTSGGVVNAGLIGRRSQEAQLYVTPDGYDSNAINNSIVIALILAGIYIISRR